MTWRAWIDLRTLCVGGSASPFIDEGDGFTSERERVCMLLSLATHAGGYEIMVGAHNTVDAIVECQTRVGGGVVFFGYDRRRYLQILLMPETCEEFHHVCSVR